MDRGDALGGKGMPLALLTMFVMFRSSTTTTLYFAAMAVVVLCRQSRCLRLALARIPAIWS